MQGNYSITEPNVVSKFFLSHVICCNNVYMVRKITLHKHLKLTNAMIAETKELILPIPKLDITHDPEPAASTSHP